MSGAPAQTATTVRTISREELRDKLARKEPFRLVMALNPWAFRAKRIPGSLHFDSAEAMFAALAKDDDIVVYCSNVDCHASLAMYQALVDHGYSNVRRYPGGLFDWESAGLPLEGDWVSAAK
jgi:rhodanese-related sulfurtransferase